MQSEIEIENGAITGTLAYIADYSAAGFEGAGHYIALKVSSSESVEGVTYKCTIIDADGAERTTTLDNDQNIVIRISSTQQKLRFTAEKDGYGTDIETLSLADLTLEAAPDDEEGT